jgi:hypothetical protein
MELAEKQNYDNNKKNREEDRAVRLVIWEVDVLYICLDSDPSTSTNLNIAPSYFLVSVFSHKMRSWARSSLHCLIFVEWGGQRKRIQRCDSSFQERKI